MMQNMLRMIGYGENLGSGFPKIISAWKQAGWKEPLLENRLDLDEVRLTLFVPFENSDEGVQKVDQKMSPKMSPKMSLKMSLKEKQNQIIEQVCEHIKANPAITLEQLTEVIGKSKNSVKRYIDYLKQQNRIKRIGGNKGGHWEIIEEK